MNISTDSNRAHIGGPAERRGTNRFPLQQDVRYRVVQSRTETIAGSGTTLNMGSTGILFTTGGKLALGRVVEVSVDWPARLDGTCPLQFVATGHVVRSESDQAAVRIEKYEFKTRSSHTFGAGS